MSGAERTLEIVWQQDPSAYVFARARNGTLSVDGLSVGTPASADLASARGIDARVGQPGKLHHWIDGHDVHGWRRASGNVLRARPSDTRPHRQQRRPIE